MAAPVAGWFHKLPVPLLDKDKPKATP